MKTKYLYVNTMGCQMNVYDTWQIQNRLAELNYQPTDDIAIADLIIVNTCTIREKAEQKAFSFLGRLVPLKEKNPELIIGIGGCVAQQEGRRILSRMPYVDLVFGTNAIGRLTGHVKRIAAERCRVVDIDMAPAITPEDFSLGPFPQSDSSAFVTIMRGCDNYCTYCVVPYVRGRESSRTPDDILAEIRHLVGQGVREVTLLGQNVNSYGQKEGLGTFDDLLYRIAGVDGLERVRFTTSHPKDVSDALIDAFGRIPKLCHHIHLPVQSGSDRVLKRMNRRYSREQYLERVDRLRRVCPDIAITSDIIVGFPGESDDDFEHTVSLIRQVGYDGLFAFIYSDRPNAPAVRFDGKIDESIKKERLQTILQLQESFTLSKNKALLGTVQQILVDGASRNGGPAGDTNDSDTPVPLQWSGRTSTNRIVHFNPSNGDLQNNRVLTGRLMDIMIERAMPHCLWGRPVEPKGPPESKREGECTNAA